MFEQSGANCARFSVCAKIHSLYVRGVFFANVLFKLTLESQNYLLFVLARFTHLHIVPFIMAKNLRIIDSGEVAKSLCM